MNCHNDFTLSEGLLETLAENGMRRPARRVPCAAQGAAMILERQKHLGAGPYERSSERVGHANGFKDKTIQTRMGAIPARRATSARRRLLSVCAWKKASVPSGRSNSRLAEMYVQGVSTRKVAAVAEKLCGFDISSAQVSRLAAEMDAALESWRSRPLGEFPYVYLDARYESVRVDGRMRDVAVLIALGVDKSGKRQILGVSVSLSEAEVHWRDFLKGLVARGLSGVDLIVSDAHAGLSAARKAVFGSVCWQRCQFHLQQNAQGYVTRQEQKAPLAASLRAVFNAGSQHEAETLLAKLAGDHRKNNPALSDWLESNVPEGLTVFAFPEPHRRLLRTTNGIGASEPGSEAADAGGPSVSE